LYTAFGPYFLYQIMSYAIIATFSSQLRLGLQWRSTDLQRKNGQIESQWPKQWILL
jgi:hypothetical protein